MKKIVTFGEIMLRLATPEYLRFHQSQNLISTFGGGEANVAVSLANFGMPVEFVTRMPKNDIAKWCEMVLRQYNVGLNHFIYGGDRLGIYFLETGAVNRSSKVVYDRQGSAIADIQKGMVDWDKVFADAQWFHWTGITPALSEGAATACLEAVEIASKKGITISCDLNFRKNLWNWGKKAQEVMPELVKYSDVILGNEEDAEKVFGIKPENSNILKGEVDALEYGSVAKQLHSRFPKAKNTIITLRGSINANHNTWSGILFDGDNLFVAPEYQITHIVDRVGGGDSFMAGIIYGLLNYTDKQKVINFATAASALKHTIYGDFNSISVEEAEKLMEGDGSGRVSR